MVNLTARQWELFAGMAGVDSVAMAMNTKLNQLLSGDMPIKSDKLAKAREVREEMYKFMNKFASFGACDTEPECILVGVIEKEIGLPAGSLGRWD